MFLSIIVPVYNSADYLGECLDSLLSQNIECSEYEIICINDGSTDNSLSVLNKYKKYPNVVIISQENVGVSATRNRGLKSAKGDYIWYVDSDDVVALNILKELKDIAYSEDYERIVFDYYKFEQSFTAAEKNKYILGLLQSSQTYNDASSVTSIIKKEVLHNYGISFRPTSYGEDSLFIYELLLHINRQYYLGKTGYYYRLQPNSSTHDNSDVGKWKKYSSYKYDALVMKDYYEGNNGEVLDLEKCANLFITFLNYALFELSKMSKKQQKLEIKQLKEVGLFPYKKPEEFSLKKSYQTTRNDVIGKIFDFIYLNQTSTFGFITMCALQHLIKFKKNYSI